jgi:hypothetical protein
MPFFNNWIDQTGVTAPVYSNGTFASNATTTTSSATRWYRSALADIINNQTTATTAYNSGTDIVWSAIQSWSDDQVEHAQYIALANRRVIQTRVRTEEERRRDEEMRARAQTEQLRLAQERAAALARSKELLLAHLTAQQRATFEREKFFVVVGGKSRQLYRVRDKGSTVANIDVLEGKPGKVTHRLCCHLADYRVPLYDHLLAQKVWIESDEEAFLRQANRHAA